MRIGVSAARWREAQGGTNDERGRDERRDRGHQRSVLLVDLLGRTAAATLVLDFHLAGIHRDNGLHRGGWATVSSGNLARDGDVVAFPRRLRHDLGRLTTAAGLRVLALAAIQLVDSLLLTAWRRARDGQRCRVLS